MLSRSDTPSPWSFEPIEKSSQDCCQMSRGIWMV
nr:MAG TPA: hypothetical protein [Caudoviricetes sp.]